MIAVVALLVGVMAWMIWIVWVFNTSKLDKRREKRMNVMLDEGVKLPTRAHDADAGYDLFSMENAYIPAGESHQFDTGVHMQIPEGFAGLLVSKSGLNVNFGLTSEGLIDSGYTGSIVVKLYNHGKEGIYIEKGQKISQIIIIPVRTEELMIVNKFPETERGSNGFGSSGL